MTTPAPGAALPATRVDYNAIIRRMAERFAEDLARVTADLVMTQVALETEQAAHAATRARLGDDDTVEPTTANDGTADGAAPTTRRRRPAAGKTGGATGGSGEGAPGGA